MSKPLSVAVLVSVGRHPVSGAPRACRGDAVAMALGRRLAGGDLRVIHAGNRDAPALQDYLALGAGRIEVLAVADGSDPAGVLTGLLKDTDLILTGSRAEFGLGSGLLPYRLAHALGRAVVNDVLDLIIERNEARVRQFLPKGKRRAIATPLPLVAAVHPMASVLLTYAHARRINGRIEGIGPAHGSITGHPATWTVEQAPRRAVPLRAQNNADGYTRMLSFIQSPAKGGIVAFDGSPVDKAQILLSYLREHRLVVF